MQKSFPLYKQQISDVEIYYEHLVLLTSPVYSITKAQANVV